MARRLAYNTSVSDDPIQRARRHRERGDDRKALLLLREACCRDERDARLWTLFSVQCWRMGKRDEALRAMRQSLWLRERERDERRARVVRGLLLAMESANAPALVRAA